VYESVSEKSTISEDNFEGIVHFVHEAGIVDLWPVGTSFEVYKITNLSPQQEIIETETTHWDVVRQRWDCEIRKKSQLVLKCGWEKVVSSGGKKQFPVLNTSGEFVGWHSRTSDLMAKIKYGRHTSSFDPSAILFWSAALGVWPEVPISAFADCLPREMYRGKFLTDEERPDDLEAAEWYDAVYGE
jgi:hypothetical protein